ncbi:MAG: HAMP domain-containing protein [Deltaproteobacteria bacterium]|nr:HAMP domain-containing protein [Deltaproteobacteria bacterium]
MPPRRVPLVGRIELRLTAAVVVMAALPLVIGILLALRVAQKAADLFYDPRVGRELEASLDVYGPLVRALQSSMRYRAEAIASLEPLRAAAAIGDAKEVDEELRDAFDRYSDRPDPFSGDPLISLASLEVYEGLPFADCLETFAPRPPGEEGMPPAALPETARKLAGVRRPQPIDPKVEFDLAQCKPLSPDDGAPMLVATFVTDRARIERRHEADEFIQVYKGVIARREEFVRLNVSFFALLLGTTILVAAGVGFALARSVSGRVRRVSQAAQQVAAGDLEVRVPEHGGDEIGDLAIAFNRMLREVERSRARIEYLQRVGAWQDMARRLAHEIKNPLTPIQLAVEETHSRYDGSDPKMKKLLDTTLEVVTEEVGTLRRLVSEFTEFARLPHARLMEEDVERLLEEIKPTLERLGLGTEPGDIMLTPSGGTSIPVRVTVETRPEPNERGERTTQIAADRQMLRKAIDNLVRNAVQAIRAAGKGHRVRVHAATLADGRVAVDVDDDGPGVPTGDRERVFDPYFTTRTEGTGLGLAIVKKIVVEHGGTIECDASPLGGARFRIVAPAWETPESRAAIEEAERASVV